MTTQDPFHRDLTARTTRGLYWIYVGLIVTTAMQVAYSAVVSRILLPEAFGIFALAGIVIRLGAFFAQFGFASALVQRPHLIVTDVPTATMLGLAVSVGVAAAVCLVAFPAATELRHADIRLVAQVLAIDMPLAALGAPSLALLRRELRFKKLALIDASSFAFGYLFIGTSLAVAGLGVWSLVAAALSQTAFESAFAYGLVRHKIFCIPRRSTSRHLVGFGGLVSVIGLLEYGSQNSDNLFVGRQLGASVLGQYAKASSLAMLPLQQLASGITRVLGSSFSRAGASQRSAKALVDGMILASGVLLPMGAGLALLANKLVPVLYGNQWSQAAHLMPILAIAAVLNLLSLLPAVVMESRADLTRKLVLTASLFVLFVGLLVTVSVAHLGAAWFAVSWIATEVVRLGTYILLLTEGSRNQRNAIIRGLLQGVILAGCAAGPTLYLSQLTANNGIGLLLGGTGWLLGITAGLAAYPAWHLRRVVRERSMVSRLPLWLRAVAYRVVA